MDQRVPLGLQSCHLSGAALVSLQTNEAVKMEAVKSSKKQAFQLSHPLGFGFHFSIIHCIFGALDSSLATSSECLVGFENCSHFNVINLSPRF